MPVLIPSEKEISREGGGGKRDALSGGEENMAGGGHANG